MNRSIAAWYSVSTPLRLSPTPDRSLPPSVRKIFRTRSGSVIPVNIALVPVAPASCNRWRNASELVSAFRLSDVPLRKSAISFARASRNGAIDSPSDVRKFAQAMSSCANPCPARFCADAFAPSIKLAEDSITALTSACLRSASVSASADLPSVAAYFAVVASRSTVMPRLSRMSGDMRPRPVTMSLNACVAEMPIARPRTEAICNKPLISSAVSATPSSAALLAESIRS